MSVVAAPGQTGAGLQHIRFEVVGASHKRNVRGEVEVFGENLDLVALRDDDVLTVIGVIEDVFSRAGGVAFVGLSKRLESERYDEDDYEECYPRQYLVHSILPMVAAAFTSSP